MAATNTMIDPEAEEFERELDLARHELTSARDAVTSLRSQLAEANDAVGAAMDALKAHQPVWAAAIQASRGNGQYAVLTADSAWRVANPDAVKANDKRDGLEKQRLAADGHASRLASLIAWHENQLIPRLQGIVHEKETSLQRHRAARAVLIERLSEKNWPQRAAELIKRFRGEA